MHINNSIYYNAEGIKKMPISICLKNGKHVTFSNENGLCKYYQDYAQKGFMEAFWESPKLAQFEASCASKPAQSISAISNGKTTDELKKFMDSLMRGDDCYKVVYGTVGAYLDDSKSNNFWKANRSFVKEAIVGILWNEDSARTFYEFLLLHLQLNQNTMEKEYAGFFDCEKEMLKNKLYKAERKIDGGDNMYSDGNGGVYYLCEDGIHQAVYRTIHQGIDECVSTKRFVPEEGADDSSWKRIRSFAMYSGNVSIIIYADGQMETTDKDITERWEEEGKPLTQTVVAYGNLYQLLTEDGRIITNTEFGDGLEDVRQVGAGLNCLSAIVGSERRLVTSEETINRGYTDVRMAGMQVGSNLQGESFVRCFLIKNDGTMCCFDNESKLLERDVKFASICERAIYYVIGADLFQYSFETKETRKVRESACNAEEEIKGLFCESIGSETRVFYWPESKDYPERITL